MLQYLFFTGFPQFKSKHDNQSCRFPFEAISKKNNYLSNRITLTNNIKDINKFSNLDIYPSLKTKIYNKVNKNNLQKIIKEDKGSNYYVNISQITGNVITNSDEIMLKDDFYTLCGKGIKPSLSPRKSHHVTDPAGMGFSG